MIEHFNSLDIRSGIILDARLNSGAKKPAYMLSIDFGEEIQIKTSSAQITELYSPESLIGQQVLGIVNLPSRRI